MVGDRPRCQQERSPFGCIFAENTQLQGFYHHGQAGNLLGLQPKQPTH